MQNSLGDTDSSGEDTTTAITTYAQPVTTLKQEAKVVIVGAGLAGLAAAQRLNELGIEDVIVLEALDRIGGRVHTISHSDYLLEMGAQWLHGADENPLYKWLSEKNMLDDFEDATLGFEGLFCTNKGEQVDPKLVSRILDILMESKASLSKNPDARFNGTRSASQVFAQDLETACRNDDDLKRNSSLVKSIFDWFLRFEAIENGGSMKEVSVASYTDYTNWDEGTLLNFKHGYRSLLDWFYKQIPAKKWIQLNRPVINVEMIEETSARPILVRYKGGSIECDHVIVTCSLGFLKNNHETFFKPPLPRTRRDLINSIGFGTVNKIILQFDEPFWNEDHGIKLVWNEQIPDDFPKWVRDIIAFDVVRRQPNLLIGWIGGQGASEMEAESDEDVANICLRLFDRFLPDGYNKPSRLVSCRCSRWYSNPYTRGSYSFQSINSFDQNVDKLHEPLYSPTTGAHVPRIMFAGEATAGELYSTTHGAILTGWREADRLAIYALEPY